MRSSPNSPNVWPGYVAAVAGLAITLLLVIAILGGDLFLVGQAVRQELQGLDGANPLIAAVPPEDPRQSMGTASPGPTQREASASASASATGKVLAGAEAGAASSPPPWPSLPAPLPAAPRGRITVTFDEDAHALDDEVRAALRTALSPLPPEQHLRLVAKVHADAPAATRRAAFIRIMAVRNALLTLDIAADRLHFQLVNADPPPVSSVSSKSSTDAPDPRTVVIEAASPTEGERHAR